MAHVPQFERVAVNGLTGVWEAVFSIGIGCIAKYFLSHLLTYGTICGLGEFFLINFFLSNRSVLQSENLAKVL